MKLKMLILKYKELLSYGFWGVMTTAVNYGVYFLLTQLLQLNYLVSNVISWIAAVAFAFVVNKVFVFNSKSWKMDILFSELWKFVSSRLLSGVLETLLLYILVDLMRFNDGIVKIALGVIVVLLNYVISKLLVFRKSKG